MADLTSDEDHYQAERRRVARIYTPISDERDQTRRAMGHRSRRDETFYVHPDVPGVGFSTRGDAARAGVEARDAQQVDELRVPICAHPGCVDPHGDRHGHHYHCR